MKARDLIAGDGELWHAATHHPFLDQVREGSLDPAAFSRWLVQDHHFALGLVRAEGRYLASAPREDFEVLARGIQAMVAELAWFEEKAKERSLQLLAPIHPTARAYVDYLLATTYAPYPVQLTALWALERAYLEAWQTALPGAPAYREFVAWTNQALGCGGSRPPRTARSRRRDASEACLTPAMSGLLADGSRTPMADPKVYVALTTAGSDPARRDPGHLKTFQRFGVYGRARSPPPPRTPSRAAAELLGRARPADRGRQGGLRGASRQDRCARFAEIIETAAEWWLTPSRIGRRPRDLEVGIRSTRGGRGPEGSAPPVSLVTRTSTGRRPARSSVGSEEAM
jgi:thiaminase/transcriptional activator TenA